MDLVDGLWVGMSPLAWCLISWLFGISQSESASRSNRQRLLGLQVRVGGGGHGTEERFPQAGGRHGASGL